MKDSDVANVTVASAAQVNDGQVTVPMGVRKEGEDELEFETGSNGPVAKRSLFVVASGGRRPRLAWARYDGELRTGTRDG